MGKFAEIDETSSMPTKQPKKIETVKKSESKPTKIMAEEKP
jgi:hypothetical protein